SAIGYAAATKLPFRAGLVRAPITGRQVLEPAQELEDLATRLQLRPIPSVLEGRRVAPVAGALVTGEALRRVVRLVRGAGAREVHLRIASRRVKAGCPYGVLSPTVDELVHARHTDVGEVARYLGSESVGFLSDEGLRRAVERQDQPEGWCGACFGGEY